MVFCSSRIRHSSRYAFSLYSSKAEFSERSRAISLSCSSLLASAFAFSSAVPAAVEKASKDDLKKAYDLTALYKGATAEDKNSWGAYVSYRYLGDAVSLDPTYDSNGSIQSGLKGWQLGAQYTLLKNVVGTAEYGQNKDLKTGNDVKMLFGRVEFTF